MGKGTYKSISDLITQGYKIIDSNTIFAGEPWEIVDPLLTEFETAFYNLRDAQSLCLNLRVEKKAAADKVKIARKDIDHAISRLKRFIKYIADEDAAADMIRDLAIEDDLPDDNDDAVSVLMSNVLPHLGDWDGTPQEISAAIKTEVTDATNAFAAAVLESSQKQDLSEVATQDRDLKRGVFEDILTRIRNFLYLMLPLERKDERLELYGFDVWGGEAPGNGEGTKWDDVPKDVSIVYYTFPEKMLVVKVEEYEGQTGFDVRIAWGPTVGAIPMMPGENTMTNVPFPVQYVEEILPGKTCHAWVRARKDDEVTDWADVASVDVPAE